MGWGQRTRGHASSRRTSLGALKLLALAALLSFAAPARPDPSNGIPTQFRPSFPVFGSGKVVNFLGGDNQAVTNAAAHVGFSLALPLLGEHFWGRKGLWVTGLSWMALTVVQESMFHAPPHPGAGYAAEVRSDLITRLVPCAALLVFDSLRGRGRAYVNPGLPPEPPGRPRPIGLEIPEPGAGSRQLGTDLAMRSGRARLSEALPSGAALLDEERARSARIEEVVRNPVMREGDPPAGCTPDLLLQGNATCSWDAGRSAQARVASR